METASSVESACVATSVASASVVASAAPSTTPASAVAVTPTAAPTASPSTVPAVPGAGADEQPSSEPVRTVVAVRGASIRIVSVVAVRATHGRSVTVSNRYLRLRRLRVHQRQRQNRNQSQIFDVPHSESPLAQIRHSRHKPTGSAGSSGSRFYPNHLGILARKAKKSCR